MDQDDLTERQLATHLGVSVRTLQNWRWLGRGPRHYKLSEGRGGRVRYRAHDVAAWKQSRLNAQTEPAT